MRKKKTLDMKFVKHAHRKAFYAYVREKGRDKFTLSHVYWYLYLRSGKGNVYHLADELASGDLGITVNSFRLTRNKLVRDGWVVKQPARRVPHWIIQTTQIVGTHNVGTHKESTHNVGTHKAGTAVVVHLPYAFYPDASPIPVSPTGFTSPVQVSELVSGAFSNTGISEAKTPGVLGIESEEKATAKAEGFDSPDLEDDEVLLALQECFPLFKSTVTPTPDDLRLMAEVIVRTDTYAVFPRDVVSFAVKHKQNTPALIPRTVKALHKAVCEGDATAGLLAQAKEHDPAKCGLCVKELSSSRCNLCGGTTYGKPVVEHGKAFCSDCMKLPAYRRAGQRSLMASDI